MSRPKEPTLFRVRLLESTAYNDVDDILNVKYEEHGDIYYYDSMHRWCYLRKSEEGTVWERVIVKEQKKIMNVAKSELPLVLNKDVQGTIVVTLKISKEMQAIAERMGYGPEELYNLAKQRFDETMMDIEGVLNMDHGEFLD